MKRLAALVGLLLGLAAGFSSFAHAQLIEEGGRRSVVMGGSISPVATLDFTSQTYTGQCATLAACITFTRASQDTDSYYTDDAGSSYNTYSTDVPVLTSAGLQVFEARTQYLTTPASPSNQTVTLTTGQHVLWAIGTGTATIAAGTGSATGLGTHTPGTPLVFNVTVGGTFNVSKTGTLNRWQLEKGTFATPFMPGASRAETVAQLTGPALTALQGGSGSAIVQVSDMASPVTATAFIGSNGANFPLYYFGATNKVRTYNNSAALDVAAAPTITAPLRAAVAWAAGGRSVTFNGNTVASDAGVFVSPAISSAYLGSQTSGTQYWLNGHVASLSFYSKRLPDATLKAKSVVGASYAANDNGVRFAFANDNLPVLWRIAL